MRRRLMLASAMLALVMPAFAVHAADVTDATGRTVSVPDHITRVLPAGQPAAVLMEMVAPDLMIGWPHKPSPEALAWLPRAAAALPATPMLTGHEDFTDQVAPLHPDMILDYGDIGERYVKLDTGLQAKTGVPTILLDGSLTQVPQALRTLGGMLGRQERAEQLARAAEAILATATASDRFHPRVVFARGDDGLDVAAPGGTAAEVFTVMGWQVLAPDGDGPSRHASIDAIRALDPDVLMFQDEAMRAVVAGSPEWSAVRAVQQHHAYVVPGLPFGWAGQPPSINRMLGVAVLSSRPGAFEAAATGFMTTFYNHALDVDQRLTLRRAIQPVAGQ